MLNSKFVIEELDETQRKRVFALPSAKKILIAVGLTCKNMDNLRHMRAETINLITQILENRKMVK